jgi:multisubunit Na+/H+ antiporter MnhC subunit
MDILAAVIFTIGIVATMFASAHHVVVGIVAGIIVMVIGVIVLICSAGNRPRRTTPPRRGAKSRYRW